MGILDGLVKGIAIATTAGIGTNQLLKALIVKKIVPIPPLVCTAATGCAATFGLLWYGRVWIQGCWYDRTCSQLDQDLTGRCVVVTGGTVGGIGFATAEIMSQMGATVIVTCRTPTKGQEAVQNLQQQQQQQLQKAKGGGGGGIHYVIIDFMSNQSVRNGAKEIEKLTNRIDYLVLNAGIARGEHASIWQTNHVGPFLLTQQLSNLLTTSARIVSVSSGAHKNAQIHWADPFKIPPEQRNLLSGAYGQSKLANILHMKELQRQYYQFDVDVNVKIPKCYSVTPGAVRTNIVMKEIGGTNWILQEFLCRMFLRTPRMGAQVILTACLDPELPGGSYLSNCRIKPSEGFQSCSNDVAQGRKLWELTERQIKENRFP